jgi:hypothetical protein
VTGPEQSRRKRKCPHRAALHRETGSDLNSKATRLYFETRMTCAPWASHVESTNMPSISLCSEIGVIDTRLAASRVRRQVPQATGTPNSGNPGFRMLERTLEQHLYAWTKSSRSIKRANTSPGSCAQPNHEDARLFSAAVPVSSSGSGGRRYLYMRHQLARLCTSQTTAAQHRYGLPEKISRIQVAQR